MIDLHVHTTMSDGTVSPRDVVRLASRKGLRAIAITDHDTVAGIPEAQDEGRSAGVEVVAGVEISAQWSHGILHILGYFVDFHDEQLLRALEYLRRHRLERIPKILSKLRDEDVFISTEDIRQAAQGGVPGRPHVANVLLQKGRVSTLQEAFDRYLKKGAPAYVRKVKLLPSEAVRVIIGAGGVAVVAHPYSLDSDDPAEFERIVRDLADTGVQGIEAFCPRHTPEQTAFYLDLATRLDLVATGGTDFHGSNKPKIKLGVIPGRSPLPYSILDELRRRKPHTRDADNRT
ncbi:MAG: PHP domain-containing protein [Desulfomonilaceae bacterium]|nr:PHP domain-containing protein [Desulfomonilaceae bacterium]